MSARFSMAIEGDTLVARVAGERATEDSVALEEAMSRWQQIAERCAERGLWKVMYVTALQGRPSSAVTMNVFKHFDTYGMRARMRIAMVHADASFRRVMELGIRIARTRGWRVQIFDSEASAAQWLSMPPGDDS